MGRKSAHSLISNEFKPPQLYDPMAANLGVITSFVESLVKGIAEKISRGQKLTEQELQLVQTYYFVEALRNEVNNRFSDLEKYVDARIADFKDSVNKQFEAMRESTNKQFEAMRELVNRRMDETDRRVEDLNRRFDDFKVSVDKQFEAMRELINQRIGDLNKRMDDLGKRMDDLANSLSIIVAALLKERKERDS